MSNKVKIGGSVFLFLAAIVVLIHFQAKRIVIELVESNSTDQVEVNIGWLSINPYASSIRLKNLEVIVKDPNSTNYKKTTIRNAFLDVASLWDFFTGGTLTIEKLELEGGDLLIYSGVEKASTGKPFDLKSIVERVKTDAIRFQIQDIAFLDFNLMLMKDSSQAPTIINHLQLRVHELYLSADSIRKRKPLIEFSLPHQSIVLPSGLQIGFDTLFFSTTDNSIQLNKLTMSSPSTVANNSYHVDSDKVRIAHFDFESFYTDGTIHIDSIFLDHSDLKTDWELAPSDQSANSSSGLPALPHIEIDHLIVKRLAAEIKVRKDTIENSFNVGEALVTAEHLRHQPDSSQKVFVQDFNILLTRYNTFLNNKNTSISFDTIQVQKNQLSLLNFKLSKATQKQPLLQTSAFELKQVDWYTLIIYNELIANEVIVASPVVHTIVRSSSDPSKQGDNMAMLNTLREFLEVNLFTLKNATARIRLVDKNTDLFLKGVNASMRIDEMLESKNINEGLDALERFSIRDLRINNQTINTTINDFNFYQGVPYFGIVSFQLDDNIKFGANELNLGQVNWNETGRNLSLNGLSWRQLEVEIVESKRQQKKSEGKLPNLQLHNVKGVSTQVTVKNQKFQFAAALNQMHVKNLQLGDSIVVDGVTILGKTADFASGVNQIGVESFSITDQGGSLKSIHFERSGTDTLETHIGHVSFVTNLQQLIRGNVTVEKLELGRVQTYYSKKDSVQQLRVKTQQNLQIEDILYQNGKLSTGRVLLESGPIDLTYQRKVKKKQETDKFLTRKASSKFRSRLIQSRYSNQALSKKDKEDSVIASSIFMTQSIKLQSENDGLNVSLGSIDFNFSDPSTRLSTQINSIDFNNLEASNGNTTAQIATGSIRDLFIHSDHLKDWKKLIDDNTLANVDLKFAIQTPDHLIDVHRLSYQMKHSGGFVKGIRFHPLKDKQAFLAERYYQSNYMDLKIDSVSLNQFNLTKALLDSGFQLRSIYVKSPELDIHRDKTHPFFSTDIKLLPTNAFRQAGFKFRLDSLLIDQGRISYTEKSRITEQEGTIHFAKLNGLVRNVKNISLKTNDSLHIEANTRFFDSARVHLRFKESYQDTLGGFLLSTRVSPFNTSILNPALVPMVSVEFQSGFVDTLQMRAIGREYISLGTMKFFYHDLKVKFLDKEDTAKVSLKNQLMKFAANTFVIRTNNDKRLGKVFYERDRNRAVFQYWVKMILSGVTTSVGAKSNKKQIKKYMEDLDQKRLPPIDEL